MINLPTSPAPADYAVTLIDYGSTLTPPLGGAEQRINRLGSKFRVAFAMPPMRNKDEGRVFVSRLIRGKSEGARIPLPLSGIDVGSPGSPVIAGAAQIGRIINFSGFSSGYEIKEGQPFSIQDAAGTHFLHYASAPATADAGGAATITIDPAVRVVFNNNAPCHFETPMIEGLVEGDNLEWGMSVDHLLQLEFAIRERK